jgi:hypothetical protein
MVRRLKFTSSHPQHSSPAFWLGNLKPFLFVVRWCLPSVMSLLVSSAGDESELESVMVHEREKGEEGYQREAGNMDEGRRTRKRKYAKAN